MFTQSRRLFLKGSAAMGAVLSLATAAFGADPIVIGIPAAQSGPVGVADHQDWTNGAMMAIEELNAKGGVLGRPQPCSAFAEIAPFANDPDQGAKARLVVLRFMAIMSDQSDQTCMRFHCEGKGFDVWPLRGFQDQCLR